MISGGANVNSGKFHNLLYFIRFRFYKSLTPKKDLPFWRSEQISPIHLCHKTSPTIRDGRVIFIRTENWREKANIPWKGDFKNKNRTPLLLRL